MHVWRLLTLRAIHFDPVVVIVQTPLLRFVVVLLWIGYTTDRQLHLGRISGPRVSCPQDARSRPYSCRLRMALIHCLFNTNTADKCQLNPISGF